MGNPQLPEAELGWLAGIIDGEGYLGLRLNKDGNGYEYVRPEMHICNTDEAIILKVRDILRKHCMVESYVRLQKVGKKSNQKQIYRLQTRDMAKMMRILNATIQYLTGNKVQRARYILEFCVSRMRGYSPGKRHSYTEREIELYRLCQPLMKQGSSEAIRSADRKRSQIATEQANRIRQYRKIHEVECENPECDARFRAYHGKKYCSVACYWTCMRRNGDASRSEDMVRPLAKVMG